MKKLTIAFIALFIIIIFSVHAQTSWTRLTPTPQENTINCITKIPGTSKLVAACEGAVIMFSQDEGNSWEILLNPAGKKNDFNCTSALFLNQNVGFISGSYLSILKTIDGGHTWNEVYNGGTTYSYDLLNDFAFKDDSIGVAVGSNGKIVRTEDGGNTWTDAVSAMNFQLNAVDFCLPNKVIAVGTDDENIVVSNDAGLTWLLEPIMPLGTYGNMSDISFTTDSIGFITIWGYPNENVLRTTDAGDTWTDTYSGYYYPQAIDIYDEQRIAISCGRDNYESGVLLTEDGGLTWTENPVNGYAWWANLTILNLDEWKSMIMAGSRGVILRSTYNLMWENLYERTFWGDIYQVQFLNQNTGFTLAENYAGGMASIDFMRTDDGGLTWNPLGGNQSSHGAFYAFNSASYILAYMSSSLTLSKTTDGGLTWTFVNTEFDFDPYCIKFNMNEGLITGEGYVIKTTDFGETWQEIIPGGGCYCYYYDIEYCSAEKIFLVGEGDYLSTIVTESNDGGNNWLIDTIGDYGAAMDIFFIDEYTAFLACKNNMILKSTDGGEIWNETTLNNPNLVEFKSIYFPSPNVGYAVGDGPFETILKTTDGGDTWNPINSHTTSGLNCVHFFDDNTGLVFGDNGVVMKTTTGGITGFEEPSFLSSGRFLEIYPNPSTDEVNIKINLTLLNTTAQLIIYNCNGEKIESLPISASMESLKISTSTLKPGIYFYQLKTGSGITETKKMIKL